MRRSALLLFLVVAVSLWARPRAASAAIDTQTMPCPVDGGDVEVKVQLSSNALLGHDRDLCPHASDEESDEIAGSISGCAVCGFAGTPAEFRNDVPEDLKKRVRTELKPVSTTWELYANRARILGWAGSPPAAIGESWLRAAWAVRLEPRTPGDPMLAEAARKTLSAAPSAGSQGKPAGAQTGADVIPSDPILDPAASLEKLLAEPSRADAPVTAADRAAAWYTAGALWRTRGELEAAETRYAKALAAAKGTVLEAAITRAIERDRASIELEKEYLGHALTSFRGALKEQKSLPAHQRALLAFLAAECARRTGDRSGAAALYREAAAAKDPEADPQMKSLVRQGLADVGAAPAPTPAPPRKKSKRSKNAKSATP